MFALRDAFGQLDNEIETGFCLCDKFAQQFCYYYYVLYERWDQTRRTRRSSETSGHPVEHPCMPLMRSFACSTHIASSMSMGAPLLMYGPALCNSCERAPRALTATDRSLLGFPSNLAFVPNHQPMVLYDAQLLAMRSLPSPTCSTQDLSGNQ